MPYPIDLTTVASAADYITPCLLGTALTKAGPTLARFITGVSNEMQRYMSRNLPAIPRIEIRNGQGINSIRTLVYPILSVSSVGLSYVGGQAGLSYVPAANGNNAGFTFDSWFINLQPGWFGRGFPVGKQNVTLSYLGGFLTPGMLAMQTLPAWAAGTTVTLGSMIQVAGFYYRCTTAGTTGSVTPTWNPVKNSITLDNGVAWIAQGLVPAISPLASYIPEDLELACLQQVALLYKNQTRVGDTSTGVGAERTNYYLKDMASTTKLMLDLHREKFPIDGMGIQ